MSRRIKTRERQACEELPKFVHAPFSDIQITPMGGCSMTHWIASWVVDGRLMGNIWYHEAGGDWPDDQCGWHVSIWIPTAGEGQGSAELRREPEGTIGLPTTARIVPIEEVSPA